MDEHLERLRRRLRHDPGDRAARLELGSALDRLGRFDEAWDVLAIEAGGEELRAALGALATTHPRAVLARLVRVDYTSARRLTDQLIACGQARHPAFVALASDRRADRALRRHARRALSTTFDGELAHLTRLDPDSMLDLVEDPKARSSPRRIGRAAASEARAAREHWRGLVARTIEHGGSRGAAAALPWLVPFLASGDKKLAARALALVQRLTDRDAPPFDVEAIAVALERGS